MRSIKTILSLVIIVIFFCSISFAELIDGPANIRDNPNGKIIFSLNNDVDVETSQTQKNGWYFIGVWVAMDKTSLIHFSNDDIVIGETNIRKGEKLYDIEGKEIGVAIEEVPIWNDATLDKKRNKYLFNIAGYTYRNNIIENSSVESSLENLINNSKDLSISYFQEHGNYLLSNEWPKTWAKNEPFRAFEYTESDIDDPSPSARIALIFYNEKLVAILHQRSMKLKDYKDLKLNSTYSIFLIDNSLGKNLKDYYQNIMMYSGQ